MDGLVPLPDPSRSNTIHTYRQYNIAILSGDRQICHDGVALGDQPPKPPMQKDIL